jgi:invasion protein IalB
LTTFMPFARATAIVASLALSAPVFAQESADLSSGEPVGGQAQGTYTLESHGDWDIRCIAAGGEEDPDVCRMYQLLRDDQGTEVAEFTLHYIGGETVEAAGTVITPLETLLTQQLTMFVDGENGRRYPFSFCNTIGCYVRAGFKAEDVDMMRKGAAAEVAIFPLANPQEPVRLPVSLTGFTAAFNKVTELNKAFAEANAPTEGAASE